MSRACLLRYTLWHHGSKISRLPASSPIPKALESRCLRFSTARHAQIEDSKLLSNTNADSGTSNLSAIEEEKYSVLESFLKYFGFTGFTTLPRAKLTASATRLYVSTTEYMDFKLFQERFSLDDTFDVWCKLLQLHMWMVMMRLKNHHLPLHKDFKFLVYHLNKSMWADLEKRAGKLAQAAIRKESLTILGENYKALVINYDEGYFSDDKALAASVWRSLLDRKDDVEPEDLLALIDYIHKNLHHLETQADDQLLNGFVTFIPLDSDKVNTDKESCVRKLLDNI